MNTSQQFSLLPLGHEVSDHHVPTSTLLYVIPSLSLTPVVSEHSGVTAEPPPVGHSWVSLWHWHWHWHCFLNSMELCECECVCEMSVE
jgi:hypothetical protein